MADNNDTTRRLSEHAYTYRNHASGKLYRKCRLLPVTNITIITNNTLCGANSAARAMVILSIAAFEHAIKIEEKQTSKLETAKTPFPSVLEYGASPFIQH